MKFRFMGRMERQNTKGFYWCDAWGWVQDNGEVLKPYMELGEARAFAKQNGATASFEHIERPSRGNLSVEP